MYLFNPKRIQYIIIQFRIEKLEQMSTETDKSSPAQLKGQTQGNKAYISETNIASISPSQQSMKPIEMVRVRTGENDMELNEDITDMNISDGEGSNDSMYTGNHITNTTKGNESNEPNITVGNV